MIRQVCACYGYLRGKCRAIREYLGWLPSEELADRAVRRWLREKEIELLIIDALERFEKAVQDFNSGLKNAYIAWADHFVEDLTRLVVGQVIRRPIEELMDNLYVWDWRQRPFHIYDFFHSGGVFAEDTEIFDVREPPGDMPPVVMGDYDPADYRGRGGPFFDRKTIVPIPEHLRHLQFGTIPFQKSVRKAHEGLIEDFIVVDISPEEAARRSELFKQSFEGESVDPSEVHTVKINISALGMTWDDKKKGGD